MKLKRKQDALIMDSPAAVMISVTEMSTDTYKQATSNTDILKLW